MGVYGCWLVDGRPCYVDGRAGFLKNIQHGRVRNLLLNLSRDGTCMFCMLSCSSRGPYSQGHRLQALNVAIHFEVNDMAMKGSKRTVDSEVGVDEGSRGINSDSITTLASSCPQPPLDICNAPISCPSSSSSSPSSQPRPSSQPLRPLRRRARASPPA